MGVLVERRLITTVGPDPARAVIGSSGYIGDRSNIGLIVPETPTTAPSNRYFFRLLGFSLGPGVYARIIAIRQLVTIAAEVPAASDHVLLVERQVQSPVWSFPTGNVAWHLRRVQPNKQNPRSDSAGQGPGTSTDMYGTNSALLYVPQPGIAPYVPPNRGKPIGEDIAGLSTFRDLKFPWRSNESISGAEAIVKGPCIVQFCASVFQPDPALLLTPSSAQAWETLGVEIEDQFLRQMQEQSIAVRYHRIAAELDVEIVYPDSNNPPPLPDQRFPEPEKLQQGDAISTEAVAPTKWPMKPEGQ